MITPRDRVQSVGRAAAVLGILRNATDVDGLTVKEVAARSGLDRTVVHRLLKSLAADDLAHGDAGRYTLGPAVLLLGQTFADRHPARRAVLPFAIDLHNRVIGDRPWIISVSIPLLDQVVILERIWGTSTPLSLLLDVGTHFPIDGTASGRAILAALDDGIGEEIVGQARWKAVLPALEEIRVQDGLSIAHGELRVGMSAIALPIGNTQSTSAALVLAGVDLIEHASSDSDVVWELRNAARAAGTALSGSTDNRLVAEYK